MMILLYPPPFLQLVASRPGCDLYLVIFYLYLIHHTITTALILESTPPVLEQAPQILDLAPPALALAPPILAPVHLTEADGLAKHS